MTASNDVLLNTDLQDLYKKVERKGTESLDERVVEQLVVLDEEPGFCLTALGIKVHVSPALYTQVMADIVDGYVFWDVLCMWINYLHTSAKTYPQDVLWVVQVAQAYIAS